MTTCPRCDRGDRIGELEVRRHLGDGRWATHLVRVCSRCKVPVAQTEITPEPAPVAAAPTH